MFPFYCVKQKCLIHDIPLDQGTWMKYKYKYGRLDKISEYFLTMECTPRWKGCIVMGTLN